MDLKHSVLNKNVSCFRNYNTPDTPKDVNLLQWLSALKYKGEVDKIRLTSEKNERKRLKASLPCITPSGLFSYRSEKKLIKHSGLIQFDIDMTANNLAIENWMELKNEIPKICNVAYMGQSVSGNGYWGLIPILHTHKHKEHFEVIYDRFSAIGIELDKLPKNIASLRGYSYDQTAYFNHNAKPLEVVKEVHAVAKTPKSNTRITNSKSHLLPWIIDKMNNAPEGQRHEARLKMGKYAGGLIASGQLENTAEDALINAYVGSFGALDDASTQEKEIKAIRAGIAEGLKYPIDLENSQIEKSYAVVTNPKPQVAIGTNEYIKTLGFDNGQLFSNGHPVTDDLQEGLLNKQSIELIFKIMKNPSLLSLIHKGVFEIQ